MKGCISFQSFGHAASWCSIIFLFRKQGLHKYWFWLRSNRLCFPFLWLSDVRGRGNIQEILFQKLHLLSIVTCFLCLFLQLVFVNPLQLQNCVKTFFGKLINPFLKLLDVASLISEDIINIRWHPKEWSSILFPIWFSFLRVSCGKIKCIRGICERCVHNRNIAFLKRELR